MAMRDSRRPVKWPPEEGFGTHPNYRWRMREAPWLGTRVTLSDFAETGDERQHATKRRAYPEMSKASAQPLDMP